jgi:hypothetical protein
MRLLEKYQIISQDLDLRRPGPVYVVGTVVVVLMSDA